MKTLVAAIKMKTARISAAAAMAPPAIGPARMPSRTEVFRNATPRPRLVTRVKSASSAADPVIQTATPSPETSSSIRKTA